MHRTTQDSITKLQQNPAKIDTRILISALGMEWATKMNVKDIRVASLPADRYDFEHTFQTMLQDHPLSNNPNITFYGAENNREVFKQAVRNIPANGNLYFGNFYDMVMGKVDWKSGLGYPSDKVEPLRPNFMWADYCHNAVISGIEEFANMTAEVPDNSIVVVTFGKNCRSNGGEKKLVTQFAGYTNGCKDFRKAVKGTTTFMVKAANRSRKVQLVFNVLYGGGGRGSSTMLVLGYAIGVSKDLTLIEKNLRENKNESAKRNYSLSHRLATKNIQMTKHGLVMARTLRTETSRKHPKITNPLSWNDKHAIIQGIKRGYDSKTIADKLEIGVMQVAGVKANIKATTKLTINFFKDEIEDIQGFLSSMEDKVSIKKVVALIKKYQKNIAELS